MSRYIDADVVKSIIRSGVCTDTDADREYVCELVDSAPSIGIVRCGECKWEWTQKCPPHRMGLIHDDSDFCSYAVRKDADKHDKAIEALGYLIKQMKGADDE